LEVIVALIVVVTASFFFWPRVAETVLPIMPSPQHPRGYLTPFFFFVIRRCVVVIGSRFPVILTVLRGAQGPPSRGRCLNEGVLVAGMPKRCPWVLLLALKRWAWTGTSRRLAAGLGGGRNLPRGAHHRHHLRRGLERHSGRSKGRLCTNYLQVASVYTRLHLLLGC